MLLTWDEVEFEFWVGQRRDGGVKAWQWRGVDGKHQLEHNTKSYPLIAKTFLLM